MIGHSMGSIILRSALKYLHKYKRKLPKHIVSQITRTKGKIDKFKFRKTTFYSSIMSKRQKKVNSRLLNIKYLLEKIFREADNQNK